MVMAEIGCASTAQLDIHQILVEAQSRWLRPAEICEILQNYKSVGTAPEPPNRPPSGSFFLFDRKVVRHFRKDGHNWRKNKDCKLAKEAHERLKLGGVDVLHCYYSYGEDNKNIQRRSYWMLEQELSHIAFVHYLEVKGNRENFNQVVDADDILASQKNEEVISNTSVDSPAASRFQPYDYQRASSVTDTTSLNNTQASEREEAEPAYGHQANHGFQSFHELQTPAMQTMDVGSIPYHSVPTSNYYQGQSSAIPAMSFESIRQGEESENPMDNGLTSGIAKVPLDNYVLAHSGSYLETVGSEDDSGIATQVSLDCYFIGPTLSPVQLFSIIDFSPNWAYSGSEIEVRITGNFLRSQEELDNYKWACMFGVLEVPAEIVGDGVLRCRTPVHEAGMVLFYITRSNRLACSEVREFEF